MVFGGSQKRKNEHDEISHQSESGYGNAENISKRAFADRLAAGIDTDDIGSPQKALQHIDGNDKTNERKNKNDPV